MASIAVNRGAFFDDLKSRGQRIVGSFGAGGERANETSLAFKEIIWPHIGSFDADFTSSGGGIGVLFCAIGYRPREVSVKFGTSSLKDVVDVSKRHQIILQNMRRLMSSGLGINNGTKFRSVISQFILGRFPDMQFPENPYGDRDTFANIPTSPTLHILATPYNIDHRSSAFVFSSEHTPEASVSRALMASCADVMHFRRQKMCIEKDGAPELWTFGDAARVEPLPLVSILREHVAHGYDPRNLTIIGVIPAYDFTPPSLESSLLQHFIHTVKDNVRNLVTNQVRYVTACGARVIIIEPNVDFLKPMIPLEKNLVERWYHDLNVGHFAACYPWLLDAVDHLFDVAVNTYFENRDKKIILAYMDQNCDTKGEAYNDI